MTLVILEGLSASGKSTVRDALFDEHPEWVKMKGENLMRKGFGDDWREYQRRYHESLHRLYELNPENVIVADRAFSEAVYNSDEQTRSEIRRLLACYGNAYIVYFHTTEDELKERGSRDMWRYDELMSRYEKLLGMFPSKRVDTTHASEADASEIAESAIRQWHGKKIHTPDI